ncbi:MAG: glycosyltransferase [Okeania sp. SIO2G4]|uniref:TIGR04283 family arsenosugar biosynthesis glycosyltransferase n=1 Tax=unclassified Okeania TaxID=2634635 RepID=UPI0013BB5D5C|nr:MULTISPECIES: TIGR04283 family arsenosugar biosynthesis glycosyltransferase [unclassified Okeania]NEP40991.1 glycosyltransferase [Okeania sp. SIO2H7]NEP73761.1 glycosyltransferase [Okeania sp. SIO2G5]NEP94419.1 glycosyltransferase [Okeania sp. SIO2F5]NEQ92287.1 glycosyltransferase [Okeania sp. SIO2G4]
MLNISIIIPTFNEAAYLSRTLNNLSVLTPPAKEILVVDSYSEDETVSIALSFGVSVIYSPQRGRSIQMNLGAQKATGEILCFIHADTIVPDDLISIIYQTLANPNIVCGGFISIMCNSKTTRWSIALHNYLKTFYAPLIFRPYLFLKGLRILFGDQVIFCRRTDFWKVDGFDINQPIMEDADLCLKLVKHGRIYLVNRFVYTSDRRVAKWGIFKANFIYLFIGFLWGFGVSPTFLKRFYQDIR